MRIPISTLVASCALALCVTLGAQEKPVAPDNSKVNQRDRNTSAPTADQQKENRTDRQMTADIRKAIVSDKTMSTYAKNIKVITQSGTVTLRGPVHTGEEKANIETKVMQVVGSGT